MSCALAAERASVVEDAQDVRVGVRKALGQ